MSIAYQHDEALTVAIGWVETALTGSAATSIAILAVAALGLGMLWGRFDLRSTGRVTLGAFILFGAPLMAFKLASALRAGGGPAPDIVRQEPLIQAAAQMPKKAPVNDPYAGAAVPQLQ